MRRSERCGDLARSGAWFLVLALGLGLVGCGGSGRSRGAKPGESEYNFALSGEIKGFDPATSNDVPNSRVLGGIYEGLLQYHYLDRPYRVIPALADGMPEVSEDGKTYTFKIKKGVRFHPDKCFGPDLGAGGKGPDGKPKPPRTLNAHDFVFSWKRLADVHTQATGWWVLDGWVVGLNEWREAGKEVGNGLEGEAKKKAEAAHYAKVVEGLQATDDHTLVVKLNKPYPQFQYVLTMTFTVPVANEAVDHYGAEFLNHPVGTGPYRLTEFVPNSRIVMEKFADWRGETFPTTGDQWAKDNGMLADAGKKLPFIDRIVYKIIVESQPAWLEFLRGRLDRATIPKDDFDSAMATSTELAPNLKQKGVKLQIWPGQIQWWVGMNMADPAFQGEKGLHLRRAIAYSHDARKFLKVIRNGRGELADAVIPPMLAAYEKAAIEHRYEYSPEKAAEELKLAGYPEGKGAPALRFDIRGSGSLSRQIAEFCKRGMEEIGLKVELVANTWPNFLKKANAGQLQVYWGGWVGDYPDEENWMQLLYGPNGTPGPNYANYKNPEYDKLYEKIRIMSDSPERRKIIQQMNNMVLRDCPWRMSFTSTYYVLHHRWLKNFVYSDPIYNWQKYLRIDEADRAKGF